MILVAVARDSRRRGVDAPGVSGKTYDWRVTPRTDGNTHCVAADFDVVNLTDALSVDYLTDAHLVTYYFTRGGLPLAKQPRVRKNGLEWVLSQGYELWHDCLFVDVDNHGADGKKTPWTPELREEFDELWHVAPVLQTAGLYLTTNGYRLIQLLDEPLAPPDVERYLQGWHDELRDAGVEPDPACRDWTRHFRLPNTRDRHSALVDLRRMTPRTPVPKRQARLADDAGRRNLAGRRLCA